VTRLLHTADTHVGYRQYHSPARRRDFLEAFGTVVDDAVAAEVDAVVHAGDLFHDRRPELRDLLGVLDHLRRLTDAGIPFLAVVGNHEATRGGQWLDLFGRLGLAERLTDEPRRVGEVALYGLDHVPPARRDELEYEFAPHGAERAVLVAHGLFTPFAHADWETETVLAASSVGFDAVLLGDNHAPGTEHVDGVPVSYAGSTERVSAAERDPRGYSLVSVDDGVEIRRRTLDTRRFVFVDVELAAGEGVERVRERVREHDPTDAVVVVTVTGEGEPVAPARVEEAALDDGALIARVTDRREFEDPAEAETVSFADPDEAVRERIEGMGLSAAARALDETIRDGGVADSNVRREAERLVRERLETGDLPAPGAAAGGGDASGDGTDEAGPETAAGDGQGSTATADDPGHDDGDGERGADGETTDGQLSVEEYL
jgi:DNA repair exonuclease SbcCD nuclease subunit